jgi:hypothetical protein
VQIGKKLKEALIPAREVGSGAGEGNRIQRYVAVDFATLQLPAACERSCFSPHAENCIGPHLFWHYPALTSAANTSPKVIARRLVSCESFVSVLGK